MVLVLLVLMLVSFSSFYPLSWLYLGRRVVMPSFTSYHFGLPCCLASIGLVSLLFLNHTFLFPGAVWTFSLLVPCYFCWNQKRFALFWVWIPFFVGAVFVFYLAFYFLNYSYASSLLFYLSFLPSVSVVFACSLGHWYLNDAGLPVYYLVPAVWGVFVSSCIRLIIFFIQITSFRITVFGDIIYLYQLTGFYFFVLILGVLGNLLLPCIVSFQTLSVLKKKATQEATGLLYVIVLSMCVGEVAFKFMTLQWGVIL